MGKKRKDSFNELIVGVFMTAVILLLGYFTIVISGIDLLTGDKMVKMNIVFDEVGGLKDHDSVMYRGTKVGKIEAVAVTPTNLVVTALVDRNVVLRESAVLSVCNLSMLGGNYLLLEEGMGAIVDKETTTFYGKTPTDWMRDVAKIAENVKELTEMREVRQIVTNVVRLSESADKFVGKADMFVSKANSIADQVEGAVSEAKEFIESATSAAKHIDSAAEKVNSIAGKLDSDKLFNDVEAGVAAFRRAAESFDGRELMVGATNVVAKIDTLVANLNAVAEKLKRGEGTLGRLASDEELYNRVNGLLKDARQILDNYRDTTPLSTFSSLATGAL